MLAGLHLSSRLERRRSSPEEAVALYANLTALVDPKVLTIPVSRDPDDDAVLAVAIEVKADLIVSGDADLLVLVSYAGKPIVTPATGLGILGM